MERYPSEGTDEERRAWLRKQPGGGGLSPEDQQHRALRAQNAALQAQVASLERTLATERAQWAQAADQFDGKRSAEVVVASIKKATRAAFDPLNERVGLQAARSEALLRRAGELHDRLNMLLVPRREPGVKRFRHMHKNGCITEVTLRTFRP